MLSLVQHERRGTLNKRRPTLLKTRVVLRPNIRRPSLVSSPISAILLPLRASSRKIDFGFALQELDAEAHADVEGDVAVHEPLGRGS